MLIIYFFLSKKFKLNLNKLTQSYCKNFQCKNNSQCFNWKSWKIKKVNKFFWKQSYKRKTYLKSPNSFYGVFLQLNNCAVFFYVLNQGIAQSPSKFKTYQVLLRINLFYSIASWSNFALIKVYFASSLLGKIFSLSIGNIYSWKFSPTFPFIWDLSIKFWWWIFY